MIVFKHFGKTACSYEWVIVKCLCLVKLKQIFFREYGFLLVLNKMPIKAKEC